MWDPESEPKETRKRLLQIFLVNEVALSALGRVGSIASAQGDASLI